MRRPILATLAVTLVLALVAPVALAGGSGWLTSWKTAAQRAAKTERPILIEFSESDACANCEKLQKDVFSKSEFKAWAKKNVVLLHVDFPETKRLSPRIKTQNEELRKKYEITSFPKVLLVNAEGKKLSEIPWDATARDAAKAWLETAAPMVEGLAGGGEWITSWDDARKLSRATGRPILADFTGSDWCGWCIKLKSEVFDTPEFKKWAAKNVILLELDFPRSKTLPDELKKQNQELQQKYGIRGYPTILFLDHAGKELGRSGYLNGGPEAWIEDAQSKLR